MTKTNKKTRADAASTPLSKCPIMYKGSSVIELGFSPRKTFELALAYALSVGRQVDVARACKVNQASISRWSAKRGPTNGRIPHYQRKLVAFIQRRSRGLACA